MSPRISVIIPVYNDPEGLRETIASTLTQAYPEELYEIIVVDNGSTDATFDTAAELTRQHPGRIRLLQENAVRGSYAARNKGIEHANGGIMCFLDSDSTIRNDYLSHIDSLFHDGNIDYVGCEVKIHSEARSLSATYQKARGFQVQWYIENRHYAPTCCLSISKRVIDRVGPFDFRLESGGDWEFGKRVHAAGFTQAFSPAATVYHPARSRYHELVKKNMRCARGEAQLSFYFPLQFKNFQDAAFWMRKYLPERPWAMKARLAKKGIEVTPVKLVILCFFHIPLNIIRFFSYSKEKRRLHKALSATEIGVKA